MTGRACPVCGGEGEGPVLVRDDAPVFCNVLWPTAEEARVAATGSIVLRWCGECGMLWNAAFDPALAEYAPGYENSLHASSVFQAYADALAERLVTRYGLRGKTIVDVGSGRGEFLALLCAGGRNRGLGFDPSLPENGGTALPDTVRIVRDLYTGAHARAARPDLVSCRHVLEHLDDPLAFLTDLRRGFGETADAVLYLEVPSGDWILRDRAVWDVIYEHPSYFTADALLGLLERAGFRALDHGTSFGDQYLWVEAVADGGARAGRAPSARDSLDGLAAAFGRAFTDAVAGWERRLGMLQEVGSVAVWGAGSKGVTFLTSVPAAGETRFVVDLNARKHGLHVPVTGREVVAPAALAGESVQAVVVLNPLYAHEVADTLRELDVDAEVLVA